MLSGLESKNMRIGLLPRFISLHGRSLNGSRASLSRAHPTLLKIPGNCSLRTFHNINSLRRDEKSTKRSVDTEIRTKVDPPDSLRPESIQLPNETHIPRVSSKEQPLGQSPKTDGLLSEQTVSNKEQRKADWAIIREMSTYLWPKV